MFIYFDRLLNSPLAVVLASLVLCGLLVMPAVAVQEPEDPEDDCPEIEDCEEAEQHVICCNAVEGGLDRVDDPEDPTNKIPVKGIAICCDNRKVDCVFVHNWGEHLLPPGGPEDEDYRDCLEELVKCAQIHEDFHVGDDNVHCGNGEGLSQATTATGPGLDPEGGCARQNSECMAYHLQLVCLGELRNAIQKAFAEETVHPCAEGYESWEDWNSADDTTWKEWTKLVSQGMSRHRCYAPGVIGETCEEEKEFHEFEDFPPPCWCCAHYENTCDWYEQQFDPPGDNGNDKK